MTFPPGRGRVHPPSRSPNPALSGASGLTGFELLLFQSISENHVLRHGLRASSALTLTEDRPPPWRLAPSADTEAEGSTGPFLGLTPCRGLRPQWWPRGPPLTPSCGSAVTTDLGLFAVITLGCRGFSSSRGAGLETQAQRGPDRGQGHTAGQGSPVQRPAGARRGEDTGSLGHRCHPRGQGRGSRSRVSTCWESGPMKRELPGDQA